MVMIANLQYGWTLFVSPIDEKYHWGRAAIQVAFTIFVLTETWLVPVEGWLVDRFGPKIVVFVGGVLVAIAWAMNSAADTLTMLYIAAAIGGIGAGAVYGTCIGNALKWFPDRRGLAAGLTAAGFGAGSALTIIPIQGMIQASGYEATFLWFGIGQGLVVDRAFAGAARRRGLARHRCRRASSSRRAITRLWKCSLRRSSGSCTRCSCWWAPAGLMATAQLAPIANDFQIAKVPVSLLGLTLPALTFALSIDRVLNGLTRPFFGWVSDRIGRENTMFIAFGLEAVGIWALSAFGQDPVLFVVLSGLVFFAWGRFTASFRRPAPTCTDQVRHDERRHALHGEGHRLAPGAPRQCAGGGERWLACGVHRRSIDERRGSNHGSRRAETVASRARQRHRRNALSPGSTSVEGRASSFAILRRLVAGCRGALPQRMTWPRRSSYNEVHHGGAHNTVECPKWPAYYRYARKGRRGEIGS